MAVTVTVTPGIVLPDDPSQPVTTAELNQLGNPTVEVTGVISTSELGPGSVNYTHTKPGPYFFASCGGTASALTLTLVPALETLTQGAEVWFKSTVDCAAGATLNVTGSDGVTGLGAKALVSPVSSAVKAGDIMTNQIVGCRYSSSGSGRWEVFTTLAYPDVIFFDATNIGGTANAITATASPAFSSATQFVGRTIAFVAEAENTSSVTVTINSIAKDLVKSNGVALRAGDLSLGELVVATYNGTAWQRVGKSSREERFYLGSVTWATASPYGTYTSSTIDGFTASPYDGLSVSFKVSATNDTPRPNLSINGLSAQLVKHTDFGYIQTGELVTGKTYTAVRNGSYWVVQDVSPVTIYPTRNSIAAAAGTLVASFGSVGVSLTKPFGAMIVCETDDAATGYVAGDKIDYMFARSFGDPAKPAFYMINKSGAVKVVQAVASSDVCLPNASTASATLVKPTSTGNFKLEFNYSAF